MKRFFDIVFSAFMLTLSMPVLAVLALLVWLQDRHNPFYLAQRVGKDGKLFTMVKMRSMVVNADSTGVDSTAADDKRITRIGHFMRRYKLDELPQFFNVLKGEMSVVGPRPNVKRETDLYTSEERRLLSVRPGITDIASIVFADEGEILQGYADPDIAYNQLIRPGKSRLGLFYVDNHDFMMDMKIIYLTFLNSVKREKALQMISSLLKRYGAPDDLVKLALRKEELVPAPPPGADRIVTSRAS